MRGQSETGLVVDQARFHEVLMTRLCYAIACLRREVRRLPAVVACCLRRR